MDFYFFIIIQFKYVVCNIYGNQKSLCNRVFSLWNCNMGFMVFMAKNSSAQMGFFCL